ncbi:MAG TPA: DJ-1/PfpI family protein [Acetobacteraceae bacterium]|nr:DJ-1/PfpI family protein [Acetobacteraceae bacterium]
MLIGIPVYDDVEMLDVTGPYDMFRWAGLDVELVARDPGPVRFLNGFNFEVKTGFDKAGAWDVLWVPGGAPDALAGIMGDPQRVYLDFLIRKSRTAKYVASVCEGALLLAAAGLLDGYQATTHWAFIPCLTERFPKVKVAEGHPRFCLDGNRLTGGGISSGLDEALRLIELLLGTKTAQAAQQTTQYYPCPPVASAIPPAGACPLPAVTIAPPA